METARKATVEVPSGLLEDGANQLGIFGGIVLQVGIMITMSPDAVSTSSASICRYWRKVLWLQKFPRLVVRYAGLPSSGLSAENSVDPRKHQSQFGRWQPAHARREQILVDTDDLRNVSYGIFRQPCQTCRKTDVPWG